MDGDHFDDLARSFAARRSRRSVLKSAGGGAAGGLLALIGVRRAAAAGDKVTVCHQPGTPAQQTLDVATAATPAHLAHGDYVNPSGCCAAGVAVCVDGAGNGTCCPAPSRCLADGTCCTPTTCAAQGKNCGEIPDGCGGTLICGECATLCCNNVCIPNCTALDECHDVGTCDPTTGACTNPSKQDGSPCSDDNSCTQTDTCQSGSCTPGTDVVCQPLDDCHDAGVCDQITGLCSNPTKADGAACDTGNPCAAAGTCLSGACEPGPVTVSCPNPTQCQQAVACNPATGLCDQIVNQPAGVPCGAPAACTNGVAHAQDTCDGAETCVPGANTTCGTGEICAGTTCQVVVCKTVAEVCSTGDVCCENLTCGFNDFGDPRTCCRPVGHSCDVIFEGGSGCCNGTVCSDPDIFGTRTCTGCDGNFNHVFGGPACNSDDTCCSGFCHAATGNCCPRLGAPCSETGINFECCIYLGHTCSPSLGQCITCGLEGDACEEDETGISSTCCIGSSCVNGTCTQAGTCGGFCQVDATCCLGQTCVSGLCQ